MDTSNLFERIEGYARENFTTETLAYILETDPRVRKEFLKLLLKRQPDLRKAFRSCEIETQPSFDYGRPDLMLKSKSNHAAAVLVEVKTQSQEGESQIQRYLKSGHDAYLAYLTPLGHDAPDLDGADTERYLGQFYWHEVHSVIQKAGSHNVLHKQFLKYLEARRMGPPEPISKNDLSASLHAADVIRKFQALVEAVREEIEPDWAHEFGKNIGGKGVNSGLATGDLPYWWFRPREWKKRGRPLFLCIGVYAEKGAHGGPRFYVGLGTWQKKFGRELEMDRKFKRLCNGVGWKTHACPTGWEYYKEFSVGTGNIDEIARRQIKNLRSVRKETRKLVMFLKNRPYRGEASREDVG